MKLSIQSRKVFIGGSVAAVLLLCGVSAIANRPTATVKQAEIAKSNAGVTITEVSDRNTPEKNAIAEYRQYTGDITSPDLEILESLQESCRIPASVRANVESVFGDTAKHNAIAQKYLCIQQASSPSPSIAPSPSAPSEFSNLLPTGSTLPALPGAFPDVVPIDVVGVINDPPSNCRALPADGTEPGALEGGAIVAQYTVVGEKVHFTAQAGKWLYNGNCWVHGTQFILEGHADTFVPKSTTAATPAHIQAAIANEQRYEQTDGDGRDRLSFNTAALDRYGNCSAARTAGLSNVEVFSGHWSDRDNDGIGCES